MFCLLPFALCLLPQRDRESEMEEYRSTTSRVIPGCGVETTHDGTSAHALNTRDQREIHQCIDPEAAFFGFTGLLCYIYPHLFGAIVAEILGRLSFRRLSGPVSVGEYPFCLLGYEKGTVGSSSPNELGNSLSSVASVALRRPDFCVHSNHSMFILQCVHFHTTPTYR